MLIFAMGIIASSARFDRLTALLLDRREVGGGTLDLPGLRPGPGQWTNPREAIKFAIACDVHRADCPFPLTEEELVAMRAAGEYGENFADATDGKHLAQTCSGCHGDTCAGAKVIGGPPDWPPAANLTPAGLVDWTLDDCSRALKDGKSKNGVALREPMASMPKFAKHMSEIELQALWAYVKALPPKPTGPDVKAVPSSAATSATPPRGAAVRTPLREVLQNLQPRRVDAERAGEFSEMILFILQNFANVFAHRVLAKRFALAHPLAIIANRVGFVLEIELQHFLGAVGRLHRLGLRADLAAQIINLLRYGDGMRQLLRSMNFEFLRDGHVLGALDGL